MSFIETNLTSGEILVFFLTIALVIGIFSMISWGGRS